MSTGLDPALEYHVVNSLGWSELRPLQRAAVSPVRAGADALLLAPTAGGKTEAAVFPLLSQLVERQWSGLSLLYLTPLRALLNNLAPRLHGYTEWLGCRAGLWHGDTGPSARRAIVTDPPSLLLTTPESLEAMLVSTTVDHAALFRDLRAVVVDELHAFAGDDRGWHLLAVLERLQRLAGRRLQRIGLSATIGNPQALLTWLGGSIPPPDAVVVDPAGQAAAGSSPPSPASSGGVSASAVAATLAPASVDTTLDYVGSVANAATVIAALHAGQKRLVFCDSRAQAESLALELRARQVTTFVSHSSLSAEERRRSEQAFAEARDCVVVATSTLELGIDVGDLDRVVQLDAPGTVASFLQRLGRTGRRPGTTRNMLLLATRDDAFLQAAGLLRQWGTGFVEPITPPAAPRHIAAQQLLALALQQGSFGRAGWRAWWGDLPAMADADDVLAHLLTNGYLDSDGDLLFVGREAEARFGRRHFMELTSVFTAAPELAVLHGRTEIGSIAPGSLATRTPAGEPHVLALAGRSWAVTHVDWRRRTVSVTSHEGQERGKSRWAGQAAGLGHEVCQSMRAVLLGEDPAVALSQRAVAELYRLRERRTATVHPSGTVLVRKDEVSRWWTYAGQRANTSLAASLTAAGLEATSDSLVIRVAGPHDGDELRAAATAHTGAQPPITPQALDGLKFSAALPADLAAAVLTSRIGDPARADQVARAPIRTVVPPSRAV